MAHAQATSLLRLISALNAQSGEWRLEGTTPKSEQLVVSVRHGADQSTIRLDAGQRGTSTLSTSKDARLAAFADSLRQGVSPSWTTLSVAAQQLPADVDNAGLWQWLKGLDVSPTILVIPGISALRSKIPAIDLGPVSLPECIASVSLRTIAVDLVHGAIAGTLTIDDARFNGDAVIAVGDGLQAVVADGRLVLTLDFTYSYADAAGSLWLQSLLGVCDSISVGAPAQAKTPPFAINAGQTRISASDVWYSFDSQQSRAESGDIRIHCSAATLSADGLALAQNISIAKPHLRADEISLHAQSRASAPGYALALTARMTGVSASFTELQLANTADFSVSEITPGPDGALLCDDLLVDLTTAQIRAMSAGISVAYGSAAYKKAGVDITVLPSANNLLVLSAARDSLTDQYGFRAKVEQATIADADAGVNVPLRNITLNHHRIEHQPRLPATHRTKTTTAVSDISFLITGFGAEVIKANRLYVDWPFLPQVVSMLGRFAAKEVGDVLTWLSKSVGAPLNFLGDVLNIALLGQVRLEGVTPFVDTLPVRVTFEPEWSGDQTLAFKVIGGIDGVGVKVAYSYPCPELTDWGHRCNESQEPSTSIPRLELELGLAVTLDVDSAAKRIRVRRIEPFVPIDVDPAWKPIFRELQNVALAIVAAIYGQGWIQEAVTAAINAALPMRLPDQWDVSRLTVSREAIDVGGNKVWGVELGLRFEEHLFA